MKSVDDPPRLLDDPGEALGDLRLGLERLGRDLPDHERLGRMAAHLGINPVPQTVTGPSTNAGQSVAAKLAAVTAVVGIVALGSFYATRNREAAETYAPASRNVTPAPMAPAGVSGVATEVPGSVRSGARATDRPVEPERLANEPTPSEPSNDSAASSPVAEPGRAADEPEPTLSREPPGRSAKRPPSGAPSPVVEAPPAPASPPLAVSATETELLRDARLVLDRDPAQALALSERHRREYPSGAFSQEREVIAITALARLGRAADAKSRAERFRRVYPSSPYITRVNRVAPPE